MGNTATIPTTLIMVWAIECSRCEPMQENEGLEIRSIDVDGDNLTVTVWLTPNAALRYTIKDDGEAYEQCYAAPSDQPEYGATVHDEHSVVKVKDMPRDSDLINLLEMMTESMNVYFETPDSIPFGLEERVLNN